MSFLHQHLLPKSLFLGRAHTKNVSSCCIQTQLWKSRESIGNTKANDSSREKRNCSWAGWSGCPVPAALDLLEATFLGEREETWITCLEVENEHHSPLVHQIQLSPAACAHVCGVLNLYCNWEYSWLVFSDVHFSEMYLLFVFQKHLYI